MVLKVRTKLLLHIRYLNTRVSESIIGMGFIRIIQIMNRKWFVYIGAFFYMSSAQAGIEIELLNERTVKEKKHDFTVKILLEGKKARYTFHTDYSSDVVSGSYLLSLDGGKSAYFVDAQEDTCHKWSNQEFIQMIGKYLFKITGRFNVKVSEPEFSKIFEKDAEKIHDLPVKHIRIKAGFTVSYKFIFFKDNLQVERISDTWLTPNIGDIQTKPLLQQNVQTTGFQKLDKVFLEAANVLTGYQLRNELTQTVTNKKGEKTVTKIIQQVKSIKQRENFPDNTFKLPECTEIDSYDMEDRVEDLLLVIAGEPL